ncbi:hypothetical protein J6590_083008 [Homalodisca vitripennis]|nr:hypothetical protein J6590_083008 [Homalodisca vitripennis]
MFVLAIDDCYRYNRVTAVVAEPSRLSAPEDYVTYGEVECVPGKMESSTLA